MEFSNFSSGSGLDSAVIHICLYLYSTRNIFKLSPNPSSQVDTDRYIGFLADAQAAARDGRVNKLEIIAASLPDEYAQVLNEFRSIAVHNNELRVYSDLVTIFDEAYYAIDSGDFGTLEICMDVLYGYRKVLPDQLSVLSEYLIRAVILPDLPQAIRRANSLGYMVTQADGVYGISSLINNV